MIRELEERIAVVRKNFAELIEQGYVLHYFGLPTFRSKPTTRYVLWIRVQGENWSVSVTSVMRMTTGPQPKYE
jgi:hypothetical protein